MNGSALLQMQAMPEYVAAAAMLALAIWLLGLNRRDPANIAFASFLVARGLSMYTFTFQNLLEADSGSPGSDVLFWEHLRPVFIIATVFALALFVLLYPAPRGRLGRNRRVRLLLLTAFLLCEAAYLLQPSLWATYQIVVDPAGGEEVRFATVGPFFAFQFLRVLAIGLAALVFARDYLRASEGTSRGPLLIFFTAFALHAIFDGSDAIQFLATVPASAVGAWTYLQVVAEAVDLIPVGIAAFLLGRQIPGEQDASARVALNRSLLVLPLPVITNLLVFVMVVSGFERPNSAWSLFFLGFWRLTLPLLATYALVKHRLFGIDVKVKRTIQRGVVALTFILVFFSVSEGAEALLVGRELGPALGIATTALLAFAIFPLQRLAERVADAAMPHVQSVNEMSRHERRALYRALVHSAAASGHVTPDEQRLLAVARERLGLGPEEWSVIEREELARGDGP